MTAARTLGVGLAAGLASALLLMLIASGTIGGLILAGMAPLPLLLAGLSTGGRAAAIATGAGTAACAIVGGAEFGLMFALLIGLPCLAMALLAVGGRVPQAAGELVLGLTALGVVAFVVAYVSLGLEPGGAESFFRTQAVQGLRVLSDAGFDLQGQGGRMADLIAVWALGEAVAVWLLHLAGNALLAQGALARFGLALRPAPAMAALELPPWLSVAFAACLAGWIFGSGEIAYVGANLAEILAVPLLLGGLAMVHWLVRRHPARLIVLIGTYVIAFVLVWPLAILVVVGIVEQWVGVRRRLSAGSNRGEK
jgi:hypothetical protein